MQETTQVSQEQFRCAMFSLFPATVRNISKLPNEQFCMIMRALIAHYWDADTSYDGEDSLVSVVYDFASSEMDRYTEKCRKNSRNRSQAKSSGKETEVQDEQSEAEAQPIEASEEQAETNVERNGTNTERNGTQDQGQDQGQGQSQGKGKSQDKNKIQNKNKNKNQNPDTDAATDSARRRGLAAAEDDTEEIEKEFEKLWERFPNKANKELALFSYQRDRKAGISEQEIRRGLERYLAYLNTVPPAERELMKGNIWFGLQCWKEENAHLYKEKTPPLPAIPADKKYSDFPP